MSATFFWKFHHRGFHRRTRFTAVNHGDFFFENFTAGTFTVDPETGARRHSIKSKQLIANIAAYAITQEVKGGVVKSAGPFLLLGK